MNFYICRVHYQFFEVPGSLGSWLQSERDGRVLGFYTRYRPAPTTVMHIFYISDRDSESLAAHGSPKSAEIFAPDSANTGMTPGVSNLSLLSSSPATSQTASPASTPSRQVRALPVSLMFSPEANSHQNPNWLSNLKKNFYSEIIQPCSAKSKAAVEDDKYIEVFRIRPHLSTLNLLLRMKWSTSE